LALSARAAFMSGTQLGLGVGASVALGGGVLALVWLRGPAIHRLA
jgi:hypothetical protein